MKASTLAPFPAPPQPAKAGHARVTERFVCVEGEGRTLGALTFLTRLSGCDLRCWWCDSKQSSFFEDEARQIPIAVLEREALASGAAWISLTGGEPTFRGADEAKALAKLLGRLRQRGMKVKVETNGRQIPAWLSPHVDLWSVAPKWDARQPFAKQLTERMNHAVPVLRSMAKRFGPTRLQFKLVLQSDEQGEPLPSEARRAVSLLKALGGPIKKRAPVFFIPQAYAKADYATRCRALERLVTRLAKGALRGWDLRAQPQWHRVLYGDARGR